MVHITYRSNITIYPPGAAKVATLEKFFNVEKPRHVTVFRILRLNLCNLYLTHIATSVCSTAKQPSPYYSKNALALAEIWISTPLRPGLKLTGKYLPVQSKQAIGIWPRVHLFGKRLLHRLWRTVIFSKMLSFRCQFENLSEIYIFLLFIHFYNFLSKTSMLDLNLRKEV